MQRDAKKRVVKPKNLPDKMILDDTHTKGGMLDAYVELAQKISPEQRKQIEEMGFEAFEKMMGGGKDNE